MDATTCPECGAPAEAIDRSALESTGGPVEHVRIICVRRHWFLMSTESLARWRRRAVPAVPAAPAAPAAAAADPVDPVDPASVSRSARRPR
jgi:hypothetical protein